MATGALWNELDSRSAILGSDRIQAGTELATGVVASTIYGGEMRRYSFNVASNYSQVSHYAIANWKPGTGEIMILESLTFGLTSPAEPGEVVTVELTYDETGGLYAGTKIDGEPLSDGDAQWTTPEVFRCNITGFPSPEYALYKWSFPQDRGLKVDFGGRGPVSGSGNPSAILRFTSGGAPGSALAPYVLNMVFTRL